MTETIDAEKQITRKTFLKYINIEELKKIELSLGYDSHYKQGLTMPQDWHVTYWKSFYDGAPCVFFSWSGIEHIFI